MNKPRGFTVIEIIAVVLLLIGATVLVISQKRDITTVYQDEHRKTSINAMHYSLQEAFYKDNQYYPTEIDESVLTTVDPELFVDPEGVKLGQPGSDYRYEATGCVDSKCEGYRLSASLENEADYIKTDKSTDEDEAEAS